MEKTEVQWNIIDVGEDAAAVVAAAAADVMRSGEKTRWRQMKEQS